MDGSRLHSTWPNWMDLPTRKGDATHGLTGSDFNNCKFSVHFCIFVNFIDFIYYIKLVNTMNLSFYCLTGRFTTAVVTIGVRNGMFLCLPSRQ